MSYIFSLFVLYNAYKNQCKYLQILFDHRPASLTAEESGACYLEGEGFELEDTDPEFEQDLEIIDNRLTIEPDLDLNEMDPNDDDEDDEEDSTAFPTTPPIYRLMVNDEDWHNVNARSEHITSPKSPKSPKTPSHRLRQELLRISKLQCTL